MNIKGFKIKNQRLQKIWVAVVLAFTIAIVLIVTSFFLIFKKSSEFKFSKEDLFDFTSYYTKYSITTYSNKNQNTYQIEEYCIRNNSDIKFRLNTINENNNYSYIVTNNSFCIKSENQISEFKKNNYLEENTNILSLATFIDIYCKTDKIIKENNFNNSGIKLEIEEKNNKICYNIIFEKNNNSDDISIYKEALVDGMKIYKLQLVLDNETKKPLEYIVFLENGNAYVDITYDEVKINEKIDEKVFSF